MPLPPPPAPPSLVWVAQPSHDDVARAEAAWVSDRFLAAMPPGGGLGAMSCVMLADGRLDVCREERSPSGDKALSWAALHVAESYRLDPTGRRPGDRVTVVTMFPRLFDHAPEIVGRPTAAEVEAAMPPGARGSAKLTCRVDMKGALDRCTIAQSVKIQPAHDGRADTAALFLATKFTVRPATLRDAPVETFEGFDIPVGPPTTITDPQFLRQPTNEELLTALPASAVRARKNGSAAVLCRVLATGVLAECKVVAETPADLGFGTAALALTRLFTMKPALVDGKPVEGAEVRIPIKWEGLQYGLQTTGTMHVMPWVPWTKAPTAADVAAAFPPRAASRRIFGHVTLRCRLSQQGVPRDCATQLAEPAGQGVATAAQRLSRGFQAEISDLSAEQLQNYFELVFDFSGRALAVAPDRYVRTVDWTRSFDPQQVQAVYPDAAVRRGLMMGRATADCRIAADGALEACAAAAEDPPEAGFGAAAVRLAQVMRVNLWTQDGEPTAGGHIKLPLRLIFGGDAKPPPSQPSAASGDR